MKNARLICSGVGLTSVLLFTHLLAQFHGDDNYLLAFLRAVKLLYSLFVISIHCLIFRRKLLIGLVSVEVLSFLLAAFP